MENNIVKVKIDENIKEFNIKDLNNYQDLAKLVYKEDFKKYFGVRRENTIVNLISKIEPNTEVEFLDATDKDGYSIMLRTLIAIYIKACSELFPEKRVTIEHSLGLGIYVTFEDDDITYSEIILIKEKMQEIIKKDYEIKREEMDIESAFKVFQEKKYWEKIELFKTLDRMYTDVYTIGDFIDTYHGYLAPSTDYINIFDLSYYHPGLIIRPASMIQPDILTEYREQRYRSRILADSKEFLEIIGLKYLGNLNKKVLEGKVTDIIRLSEARQERDISKIADEYNKLKYANMILIAGPTSSGKTSFANRLSTHLRLIGKEAIIISTDDYFIDREKTPLKEDGSYDFENINAIDLEYLNNDLIRLLEGEEVELPKYNFLIGKKEMSGKTIKLSEDNLIIIEGIHSLNPELTNLVPEKNKFKIYISALTQLGLDAHNIISDIDIRFIRRLVRDYKYRGFDPEHSFELWDGVREGEEKYIFPFQDQADIMIDSGLVYELNVLKKYAVFLLRKTPQESVYYSDAKRLLKFLDYFVSIEDESAIPPHSILREFIGGADKSIH